MSYETDVMQHKTRVSIAMTKLARDLVHRGKVHDNTKLQSPEREIYEANIDALSKATFGTDEYDEALNLIEPALVHHYKHNDHHPEHFGYDGFFGMNLIQIIEMLCDINAVAASKNEDPIESLPTFMRKKEIPENYYQILKNTLLLIRGL